MTAPHLIPEAEKILAQNGYLRDPLIYAYRRTRNVKKQTTEEYRASQPVVITYEQLSDHRLLVGAEHTPGGQPTAEERRADLRWLREQIQADSER